MTYAPISKAFFGVPEDDANFNLPEAVKAYQTIMKMDDDAAFYLVSSLVFDKATEEISANRQKIQKFVDDFYLTQFEDVAKRLKRAYISKGLKGEDTQSLEEAYELITKAWDPRNTPRGGNPKNVGQFSHFWGSHSTGSHAISYLSRKPMHEKVASERYGIPAPGLKLSKDKLAAYQQAYQQVKEQLDRYTRAGLGDGAAVNYVFEDNQGRRTTVTQGGLEQPTWKDVPNIANKRLVEFHVNVPADINVQGAGFNVLQALGGEQLALYGTEAMDRVGPATSTFESAWNKPIYGGANTEPFYQRLGAASELVETLVPDHAFKLRFAAKTGKLVGQYGPEAEKVLGPHARRSAYRYRGVEKAPDPAVLAAMSRLKDKPRSQVRGEAIGGTVEGTKPGQLSREQNGFLTQYLARRLPSQKLGALQLKSGVTPPSQGFIIDGKGNVVTEAVGYGDDHYLPFNLKNLGRLRGGEYVRTRSTGGPTTEDIYAGLVSGARSLTVVSRSGVFTVNFDDTFRGARRYNDKAARMVTRYGKLLDAIKGGNLVLTDVSNQRKDELRLKAEEREPYDKKMREDFYENELKKERRNPIPSRAEGDTMMARANAQAKGDPEIRSEILRADMDKYTQEHFYRTMKLDADGYSAALLSLQEQFPYYFKNPQIRRLPEREDYEPRTADQGYVKPRYLRPEAALEGYFDPTVIGVGTHTEEGKLTGKTSADKTNYANWRYNKLNPAAAAKLGEGKRAMTTPAEESGPTGARTAALSPEDVQAHAAFELYNNLRSINKVGDFPINWELPQESERFPFPYLTGQTLNPEEFVAKYKGDKNFQVGFEENAHRFTSNVPEANEFYRKYTDTKLVKPISYNDTDALRGPGNFDFGPDFAENHTMEHYTERLSSPRYADITDDLDARPEKTPEEQAEGLIRSYGTRIRTMQSEKARGVRPTETAPEGELLAKLRKTHEYHTLLRRQRTARRQTLEPTATEQAPLVAITPDELKRMLGQ